MKKLFRKKIGCQKGAFIIALIIIIVSALSCRKIFEKDLSEMKVVTNMPLNNFQSSSSYVQFWWEELEGASFYNIQMVRPNFDTIVELLIDSNVTINKFEWSFPPGKYSWRIKACNSSSCTPYQTYTFNVDSTLDLSNTKIILISPLNYKYLNDLQIEFSWLNEYNADHYVFSVYDSLNIPIINHKTVYNHKIKIPSLEVGDTLKEGVFKWVVYAENSISISQQSSHICIIDRKAPSKPSLLKPYDNSQLNSSNVAFQWLSGIDANYYFDSLFIYTDSNQIYLNSAFRSTSHLVTDSLSSGSYFWYVRTYDRAGNYSINSEIRKIIID